MGSLAACWQPTPLRPAASNVPSGAQVQDKDHKLQLACSAQEYSPWYYSLWGRGRGRRTRPGQKRAVEANLVGLFTQWCFGRSHRRMQYRCKKKMDGGKQKIKKKKTLTEAWAKKSKRWEDVAS